MTLRALTSSGLLVGLSLYWALSTFTGIEESFSTMDLIAFSGTGAFSVLLQILTIIAVDGIAKRPLLTYIVTGTFISLNAFTFNLAFAGDFLLLGAPLMLLSLAAGCFVATVIVRIVDENPRLRPFVVAVVAVLIVSPFIFLAVQSDARIEGLEKSEVTASPNIRKVSFQSKPNVYFIGFDAAAPAVVLEKYLGLKQAPLPIAFQKNGFRVFPNLFTERYSTLLSWKILLALDQTYYETLPGPNGGLMQGLNQSPLIQIFKHNGYEVSTLYKTSYFGARKGPYVDHYRYNTIMSVCDFIGRLEKIVGFFGACFLRESALFPRGQVVVGPEINFLMHYLTRVLKREKPQVLFAHLKPPFHVHWKEFNRNNQRDVLQFKEGYRIKSIQAGKNLALIKKTIIARDPNAIIFVFGDHGVYLSNREKFIADEKFMDNNLFFVQDRFGVVGGIYPADTCSEYFDGALGEHNYLTITWVARLIVQCLAGGVDPFTVDYKHSLFLYNGVLDPRAYVYE